MPNGPVFEWLKKWRPKHSKTGRIRPVFECKMAAKSFENRTQKSVQKMTIQKPDRPDFGC
jgi:hypothetical protein